MKNSVKLWLEALRSGKYKQVKNVLKDKDGKYCCLGVACEVYKKVVKKKCPIPVGVEGDLRINSFTENVQKWLGLKTTSGEYMTSSLAEDNDHGKSFKEIANIIEQKQNSLFEKE